MEIECPDGWQLVRLRELGEVNRGRSRHRPRYAEHLYGGPYPFIQTGDVKASNGRVTSHTQTYSEAGLAQSRLWPAGTMCITIAANIAETGILTFPACFPDSVVGFIAEPSKADIYFVEYMFRFMRNRIQHQATGSVQDNINIETLERLSFPVPPLAEQRAIAAVLGVLDDKIELNRRMNATLEAIARALFQSWFVDFDPVRAKLDGRQPVGLDMGSAALFPEHLEETALGHTPKGWEVGSLDKIAEYLNGLALQKYPPGDGPTLPVIKIAQLRKGDSGGADRCNTDLPPSFIVHDGDVLFSWSGSLEIELWCGGPGALNQHLFKVTSREFPKWFYYLWTLYHLDEFRLIAADKATTMGHIQRGHLRTAKVLIPPLPLLDAMSRTMLGLIDQLIASKIQSRSLATLRDALLPQLLSGSLEIKSLIDQRHD
jgi:type I restriction enzyme S subunit